MLKLFLSLLIPISLANTIPIEITEVFPDPEGIDHSLEYIVLANTSNSDIGLTGLYLDDQEGESSPYSLNDYIIPPLGELCLYSSETNISINNNGDQIRILDTTLQPIIALDIPISLEGSKYLLTKDGYTWEHEQIDISAFSRQSFPKEIAITEIMPNPEENETDNEWIEIKNLSQNTIDLQGLLLDDNEDGSSPYEIPSIEIAPLGYAVISRSDSKIALNNSNDSARILTPNGDVLTSVEYEKTEEGLSYQLITIINTLTGETSEEWQWAEPTEGTTNNSIYNISGQIEEFDSLTSALKIKSAEKTYEFDTSNLDLSEELLGTTFQPETEITLLYRTINGENQIENFEIKNESTQSIIEIENTAEPLYKQLLPYATTILAIVLLGIYEHITKKSPATNDRAL